jgi:hypothetical protein
MNWQRTICYAAADGGTGGGTGESGSGDGGGGGGAAPGGAAGAAAGDGKGDGKGDGGTPPAGEKGKEPGSGRAGEPAVKVPDKFLVDGKPDYAKLTQAYNEAERALMRKGTEVKAEVEREFHESRAKAAPATPGDYQVMDKFILGDREVTVIKDDPMMDFVRTVAHANHWTQQEFDDNLKGYVAQQIAALPKWTDQAKILGPLADQRHQRVDGFLRSSLSAENYATFAKLPATAATIKAIEELMELSGHPRLSDDTTAIPSETLSRDQLREMQRDPRYTGERGKDIDPSFVARVRAGYRALAKNGGGR